MVRNGHPLREVGLFYGSPEELGEQIPRDGGWDLNPTMPPAQKNYTLLCKYRGTSDTLTVVLPRGLSVCEFPHFPRVSCR